MTTKTNLKAGGWAPNHNETLRGVAMKTQVKAGRETSERLSANHNESMR
jgi:hypothetical protein